MNSENPTIKVNNTNKIKSGVSFLLPIYFGVGHLVDGLTSSWIRINSQKSASANKNVLVLDQNVPNPFAESTVISYNIPDDFTKAQIIFTTNGGVIIKSLDITEKGAGSLNVFANDLSHGMYSYSLIIDGKTVATKKMIKE